MTGFYAELIGTMVLIVFGSGVVAGNLLIKSKSFNMGWVGITIAWALGVTLGVYVVAGASDAHLNPAVTLAFAMIGAFPWAEVPAYIAGQMIGAMLGAVLVYLVYSNHWKLTESQGDKLGIFATGPADRNYTANFITEIIGTFMLTFGLLSIGANELSSGFNPIVVGLLILAIGLSLGGPTGYAINPARDLGPRIAHAILPIAGKGDSDWGYAWIPVVGPIVGGIAGAYFYDSVYASHSVVGLIIFIVIVGALVFVTKSSDQTA
ncbi:MULTISPECIES: MIP/aquaporin family protein [Vagococcus]|uniref:Glycerol uptake facilitator protein n=1 Tax=Vagococcus lutrae LBD1 TaxID=1408226 RepID=V6Q2J9_9ENTE|nr:MULTISPECIES: MIP/aquaporin family protein [Vagococcus]EST89349.1 hypothetical protein T233_01484 [Vagococcus lutrae LBD1]MDT2808659.1 aquaporin family protein [Vagococcus lutrae]NKZ27440.1 aquaporin family protein [Vagococcus lutrae]HCT95364.1 aquaporin family protein [Vagococcus sp.]